MKKYFCLILSLIILMAFGCSNNHHEIDDENNEIVKPVIGKYNQLTYWDKIKGNERNYTKEGFYDPSLEYRLLAVLNKDPTDVKGSSIPNLERLKRYGYGGVVTNVGWSENYLYDEDAWELFVDTVKEGIEDLGLRFAIYDEFYYPSGGARNIVLKDNEEWQAQGLAKKTLVVERDSTKTLVCPKNHTLVYAKAYSGKNMSQIDVNSSKDCLISDNGDVTFSNNESRDYTIIAFYQKNWYEGTHPQYNLMESRRYIDLLRREPIEKFLEVTYDQYYKYLGEYFNNGVEFFFYDEPALPSYKEACTPLNVLDEPDMTLELLDTVVYSPKFKEEFLKDHGYDPEKYFPFLFKTNDAVNMSDEAIRFRINFYETVSRLVEENFFGQIGKWCENHNIIASGHLLGEEYPSSCVLCSGNIMRDYSRVQMPGIDFLFGKSEAALENINVCKTVSSVANFYGKSRVFCEVSDFSSECDNWDSRIASIALAYLSGVNNFVSYYDPFGVSEGANKYFTDTLSRLGYMLGGGVAERKVAVYYPIEGLYASMSNGNLGTEINNTISSMNSNFRTLVNGLTKANVDYLQLDKQMLKECKYEEGKIITPSGEELSTLIIPKSYALYSETLKYIKQASECGVDVILQDDEYVCDKEDYQKDFDILLRNLINQSNVNVISDTRSCITTVKKFNTTCFADTNRSGVVGIKQINKDNSVYAFVNSQSQEGSIKFYLSDTNKKFKLWNVYDGSVEEIEVARNGDYSTYTGTIQGYEICIITAE